MKVQILSQDFKNKNGIQGSFCRQGSEIEIATVLLGVEAADIDPHKFLPDGLEFSGEPMISKRKEDHGLVLRIIGEIEGWGNKKQYSEELIERIVRKVIDELGEIDG